MPHARLFADMAAEMSLQALPEQLIRELIWTHLSTRERLLTVPLVCRAFQQLVEGECKAICAQRGWQLARRPRGTGAVPTATPWRRLYLGHSCACCLDVGDFCARATSNSHARFLLCGQCARCEAGRALLVPDNLKLDVTGLSGKALYTARADRFCASMHAEGVKRARTALLLCQHLR